MHDLKISLVIPVRDEAATIPTLLESIGRQTFPPDETVIVDGGSTDETVAVVERLAQGRDDIRLVKTDGATPGRGRNLGIEAARNEWIALTDAGIKLEDDWLEMLAEAAPDADFVFGNFAPVTDSFFTRCAALAYVSAQGTSGIRAKFIASSLVKKSVWEKAGKFPDLRAAEDLMFIENAERNGARVAYAPKAMVHWQLRPDIPSTFSKFVLYSNKNVLAGRQWDWHYGVLKQYALLIPFIVLAFLHSWWWLIALPLWLAARTAKRLLRFRNELGMANLFRPLQFVFTSFLILLIDTGTFVGWAQAKVSADP